MDIRIVKLPEIAIIGKVINAWYKPEEDKKFKDHGYVKANTILFYELPVSYGFD